MVIYLELQNYEIYIIQFF